MKQAEPIRKRFDDFWIAILTCVGAILVLFLIPEDVMIFLYLRYMFGILITLFLPGYALTRLLFMTNKELDLLELLGLSIVFSAILDILVGAILYYTWEISLNPAIVILTAFTITFLIASKYLGIKLRTENDIQFQ